MNLFFQDLPTIFVLVEMRVWNLPLFKSQKFRNNIMKYFWIIFTKIFSTSLISPSTFFLITTRSFRMALIAGGTATVLSIGGAISGAIALFNDVSNSHDREMASLANQHKQSMKILENEQNSENNRHKEFMKLFDSFDKILEKLGDFILKAECEGCKGLPGFLLYFISPILIRIQRWSVHMVEKKLRSIMTIISNIFKSSIHKFKSNWIKLFIRWHDFYWLNSDFIPRKSKKSKPRKKPQKVYRFVYFYWSFPIKTNENVFWKNKHLYMNSSTHISHSNIIFDADSAF